MICPKYCKRESLSMPMIDMTAVGNTVSVTITIRIMPDTGSQNSSG